MEQLCKLYQELANVVPVECRSSREIAMQRNIDKYGVALMMIEQGCEDPAGLARKVLADFNDERITYEQAMANEHGPDFNRER